MKTRFLCFLPVFIVGLAVSIGYKVHSKNKTSELVLLNAEAIANGESSNRKGPASPSPCFKPIKIGNTEETRPCQTFTTVCGNTQDDTECKEVQCSTHTPKD